MAGAADFVAPRPLAVTVGNYLLMYADGRFARHPRFRYFALNTEMRWRALQAGWIYVRQHPQMPSSFSSIVLTWLLFISTIIVLQSQALRRKRVYSHVRSGSPPNAPHSSSFTILSIALSLTLAPQCCCVVSQLYAARASVVLAHATPYWPANGIVHVDVTLGRLTMISSKQEIEAVTYLAIGARVRV